MHSLSVSLCILLDIAYLFLRMSNSTDPLYSASI